MELGIVAVLAGGALVVGRWHFTDKREQRTHELELRKQAVSIEQATIDGAIAEVRKLTERVKTLEYRPK